MSTTSSDTRAAPVQTPQPRFDCCPRFRAPALPKCSQEKNRRLQAHHLPDARAPMHQRQDRIPLRLRHLPATLTSQVRAFAERSHRDSPRQFPHYPNRRRPLPQKVQQESRKLQTLPHRSPTAQAPVRTFQPQRIQSLQLAQTARMLQQWAERAARQA